MKTLAELREELSQAQDKRDAAYWRFTRCAQGQPVTRELSRRVVELEIEIERAMRTEGASHVGMGDRESGLHDRDPVGDSAPGALRPDSAGASPEALE